MSKKFIKRFSIITIAFLVLIIGVSVLFDPFYHYHEPVLGLKKVLVERNYPLPGSIDHFDYNAVQAGSSVMENNNDAWFNSLFDCESLKIAKGSATVRELTQLIDRSYESHELKYVFFSIHPAMFLFGSYDGIENEDFYYLYDNNIFNDTEYILNKDILLKKIPVQIAYSSVLDYDEGESYNWYSTKNFSKESLLAGYYPYDGFIEGELTDDVRTCIDENVKLLTDMVAAHPETTFYFYYSPASMIYWDSMYREGSLPSRFYEIYRGVTELSVFDNVTVSLFNTRSDIILNFDNYMDSVHYSKDINYEIAVSLKEGRDIANPDNIEKYLSDFKELIEEFSHNGILEYYPDAVVD